jgi:DNA-binding NtrC family response regulator
LEQFNSNGGMLEGNGPLPFYLKNGIMKSNNKTVKIVVIEDNEFFNQLLTTRLKNYIYPIADDQNFQLQVHSYTNPKDALLNMESDTDIVFLDYYLGDSVTGMEVMKKFQKGCESCSVVIVSQVKSLQTSLVTLLEGASEFILKDKNAITKSCYIAEEMIYKRLKYI